MDYHFRNELVETGVERFQLYKGDQCLTQREVHQLWRDDSKFALMYSKALLHSGYSGFCWETPPVTTESLDSEHEFVVVKSDRHQQISPDSTAFSEHFSPGELAVAFPNLGRNGIMIAPTPDNSFNGGSIASFLRTASKDRIAALWSLTGIEVTFIIGKEPLWVSTAGLGVPWLHIRLDSRPKYYRYSPYKQNPQ